MVQPTYVTWPVLSNLFPSVISYKRGKHSPNYLEGHLNAFLILGIHVSVCMCDMIISKPVIMLAFLLNMSTGLLHFILSYRLEGVQHCNILVVSGCLHC